MSRVRDILAGAEAGPTSDAEALAAAGLEEPSKRERGRPKGKGAPAGKPRRPRAADFDAATWIAEHCTFLCDRRSNVYLCTRFGDHPRHVPVLSDLARYAVRSAGHVVTGQLLGPAAVETILRQAEGAAQIAGPFGEPFIRLGWDRGDICIDRGTDGFDMIRVSSAGCRVEPIGRLPFVRPPGFGALPEPVEGGNVHDFRRFLNCETEHDFTLTLAWLITSLRPSGPYPLLLLGGEQGSAKSTVARTLRALVDPNDIAIRAQPKDVDDVIVGAFNSHVLAYDNASRFDPWLSDLFCIVSTGGGIISRKLYSDTQEAGFNGMRPVVVSAITNVLTQPDLAQRAYSVRLKRIEEGRRQTERAYWREWGEAAPLLFGVLLDGLSAALRRYDEVEAEGHRLPRMADAALWSIAAEPGLGLEPGAVLRALEDNANRTAAEAFESDPVALALHALLPDEGARWSGTMSGLLDALNLLTQESVRKSAGWPKTPQGLTAKLARVQPVLRSHGLVFSKSRGDVRHLVMERLRTAPPEAAATASA